MKKTGIMLFILILLLTMFGCGRKEEQPAEETQKAENSEEVSSEDISSELVESEPENSETVEKEHDDIEIVGIEIGSDSESSAEPEEDTQVIAEKETAGEDTLEGMWYGWDTAGNLLALYIETSPETGSFRMESYGGIKFYKYNIRRGGPAEIPEGAQSYSGTTGGLNLQIGEHFITAANCEMNIQADGTLLYREYVVDREDASVIQYEAEWIFYRNLPWTQTYDGKLNGLWYAGYEDDYTYMIMSPDGYFTLVVEEEIAKGSYTLEGQDLTLTAEWIDGEEVSGDDFVLTLFLTEDGSIAKSESQVEEPGTYHLMTGSLSAAYAAGEDYSIRFREDGTFYFKYMEDELERCITGFYTVEEENVTLYGLFDSFKSVKLEEDWQIFAEGTLQGDTGMVLDIHNSAIAEEPVQFEMLK